MNVAFRLCAKKFNGLQSRMILLFYVIPSLSCYAVPAPTSVILSSSVPNPVPPGSPVTLTCAVELSPVVNVSVVVNTVLTTPDGFQTPHTAALAMGSFINFTSEFVISSFRRMESGLFICTATVSLSSNAYISDSRAVSHTIRITTGEMFTVMQDHHSI